jgi:hypothetical protein
MTTVKYIIQNSFPSIKINIIHYEEISMIQNVDLIISNPAYGPRGANITYNLKDQVTYREFINLLPANDYQRNSDKNLFNFQSDMIPVPAGFEDAAVTTHLARIHPTEVNTMTVAEFEHSQYIDPQLDKYFRVLRTRSHYAIDAANLSGSTDSQFKQFDINTTVTVSSRDVNHHHLPYSRTCETYRYNVTRDITNEEIFESRKALRKGVYDGWLSITGILNNTAIEKTNQVNFMYSSNGFRFLAKVFTAVNVDGTLNFGKVFPKVDWTRAWTVEEILADYGYTEEEIAEVMTDLNSLTPDGKPKYKWMGN